ncbi:hypothetical protein BB558_001895, partial [Smittium angustum]
MGNIKINFCLYKEQQEDNKGENEFLGETNAEVKKLRSRSGGKNENSSQKSFDGKGNGTAEADFKYKKLLEFDTKLLKTCQEILSGEDLPSSFLSPINWTLISVDASGNYKTAKVFYSINHLEIDRKNASYERVFRKIIKESAPFISELVTARLNLRTTIKLLF